LRLDLLAGGGAERSPYPLRINPCETQGIPNAAFPSIVRVHLSGVARDPWARLAQDVAPRVSESPLQKGLTRIMLFQYTTKFVYCNPNYF
jgi:hypothetical protein